MLLLILYIFMMLYADGVFGK